MSETEILIHALQAQITALKQAIPITGIQAEVYRRHLHAETEKFIQKYGSSLPKSDQELHYLFSDIRAQ